MSKAWGLLTVDESERNYSGNAGYEDVLGKRYIWDENVPSRKEISKGDLVILRDGKYVLGLAWIDTITPRPGSKDRFRCPRCTSTKFYPRTTKLPKYRCDKCKYEFDHPTVEHLDELMFYEADYERTWQPLDVVMPKHVLEPAFLGGAKQNGIRELNADHAKQIIEAVQPSGDLWWASSTETKVRLPGGHYAVLGKARIGQQRFREEMLKRFKGCCAISGPLPGGMLDAAHVYRYADEGEHYLEGGLLLRRDLHALFDRWELLIDPDDDWRVWIKPDFVQFAEVWRFNGKPLLADKKARPQADYLRIHAAITREKWKGH
jgi:hypothetical protein